VSGLPVLNVDLLDRTLAHIEANPQEWDQRDWRCGTRMCFAGHAALLSGGVFPFSADDRGYVGDDDHAPPKQYAVQLPDGSMQHVEDCAIGALGLTADEADHLFDDTYLFEGWTRDWKLDDLRGAVARVKAGEFR
jgi:hypothetical protein